MRKADIHELMCICKPPPKWEPVCKVHILCLGLKTEPDWFGQFKKNVLCNPNKVLEFLNSFEP